MAGLPCAHCSRRPAMPSSTFFESHAAMFCATRCGLVGGTTLDTALHALPFFASPVAQRMLQ
jgi:hypothetical protein